jgi:hypothetical protein
MEMKTERRMKIEESGSPADKLSVRARNALKNNFTFNHPDFAFTELKPENVARCCRKSELRQQPNVGEKTVIEIEQWLSSYGRFFEGPPPSDVEIKARRANEDYAVEMLRSAGYTVIPPAATG